ncbi:hypothetical protein ACH5RR_035195 [Cinchona calisaya]|uniref:Very-long-chain (3R)-3-hydroxyacyl-CoA dehydratase n=1 Tax=Cinchona calisaya TaxID=153742 RepID=A0ABD2YGD2_9GENT
MSCIGGDNRKSFTNFCWDSLFESIMAIFVCSHIFFSSKHTCIEYINRVLRQSIDAFVQLVLCSFLLLNSKSSYINLLFFCLYQWSFQETLQKVEQKPRKLDNMWIYSLQNTEDASFNFQLTFSCH